MGLSEHHRVQSRRAPLGDATRRVNNSPLTPISPVEKESFLLPHNENSRAHALFSSGETQSSPLLQSRATTSRDRYFVAGSPGSNVPNPRLSAISKDCQGADSNRNSQISTTSTNGSDGRRRKTHIGPWHLGKTLGKGATARVRMARHAVTGQLAAIKIVQKKNAQLSQAGSLAALDQRDSAMSNSEDGSKRMPFGIEREVAIMKLIEHPHIMKLYDIWENRTEIYLVLEYIDNGELFEHISRHGSLGEEEAVKYFRQLLSAVGYCHSFNICHRDLKPENILLTKAFEIKVADFGMAALHQTPDHRLQTSCGSPHYAAPEVIRAVFYRGDKADIWSMGVILFASLAGFLPFDHEDLPGLLEVIKKGRFQIPPKIGPEAADLIHRMLQLNPRDRVSISQMWRHPLLRKYDYIDDYGSGANPRSLNIWRSERTMLRRSDIDRELLRHLRSMWHTFEEQQIIKLLLSDEPNEQKVFYDLLLKHRDSQLENYVPEIGHSTSDYHHAKPLHQVKKLSNRQFSQPNPRGHGRAVSRFTVVSNVSKGQHSRKNSGYADTEAAETVQSYDPFRASRPQNFVNTAETGQTNVVIYRGRPVLQDLKSTSRSSRNSNAPSTVSRNQRQALAPPRNFASRSSLASSTRSRGSGRPVRLAAVRKRGVSFSHVRKLSETSQMNTATIDRIHTPQISPQPSNRPKGSPEYIGDERVTPCTKVSPLSSANNIRSKKKTISSSQPLLSVPRQDRVSRLWNDDVRQLSSSLAKTCDEAFNRTSEVSSPTSRVSGFDDSRNDVYDSPMSSFDQGELYQESMKVLPLKLPATGNRIDRSSLDSRPLPAPPTRSESVHRELTEARKKIQLRKISGHDSPGHLDRMVSHIDQLMLPTSSSLPRGSDRRTFSEPVPSRVPEKGRPLPSIHESNREGTHSDRSSDFENFVHLERVKVAASSRHASTPAPRLSKKAALSDLDDRTSRRDERARGAEALKPLSPSPAKPPAPLNIRKKSSQGPPLTTGLRVKAGSKERPPIFDLRQQYVTGSSAIDASRQLSSISEKTSPSDPLADESSKGTLKKKANWFKRNSKGSDYAPIKPTSTPENTHPQSSKTHGHNNVVKHLSADFRADSPKKKSFGLGRFFGKRSSKHEGELSTSRNCSSADVSGRGFLTDYYTEFEIFNDNVSITDSIEEERRNSHLGRKANLDGTRNRQIEPQQNWLARLFHVKPATKFICFSVTKRRARQEIASLLKEWRKYGMKDIVADKERNIVFGRVGPKNYFQMKEVAFASEILTVIEHGKRFHLSIARFTQEKGAASSFYRVVDTLETVMKSRGMLVSDERKKRMIIKTLNAA